MGIRIGSLLATSLFVALNSVEFCNTWIFKDGPRAEPLVSLSDFIFYWSVGQCCITLYVLFCEPEKVKFDDDKNESQEEDEEITISPNQIIPITCDLLQKKSFLNLLAFIAVSYSMSAIPSNLS